MENDNEYFHFVSTHNETQAIISRHAEFWVADCMCRKPKNKCQHGRIDVCLSFDDSIGNFATNMKKVDALFVQELIHHAEVEKLVTRPFRDEDDPSKIGGICFCCDDCCEYFTNPEEKCGKGKYIQYTDLSVCTDCGQCLDSCYFGARALINGRLLVNNDACYGCGLCVPVCPISCIEMKPR